MLFPHQNKVLQLIFISQYSLVTILPLALYMSLSIMEFTVNIYSTIQSGNHIAFSTIYVFEHIEASQTKRRDNIYVVIKVW